MIIYNITFSVPKELHNDFLDFIRDEYIPQAMKNNIIDKPRLSRIFSKDEDEGYSYALEFKANTIEELEEWNMQIGRKLYFLLMKKFRQNILGFATVLQPVSI